MWLIRPPLLPNLMHQIHLQIRFKCLFFESICKWWRVFCCKGRNSMCYVKIVNCDVVAIHFVESILAKIYCFISIFMVRYSQHSHLTLYIVYLWLVPGYPLCCGLWNSQIWKIDELVFPADFLWAPVVYLFPIKLFDFHIGLDFRVLINQGFHSSLRYLHLFNTISKQHIHNLLRQD